MVAGAPQADGLHDRSGTLRVRHGGGPGATLRDAKDRDKRGRSAACHGEQQSGSNDCGMARQPFASSEGDRYG